MITNTNVNFIQQNDIKRSQTTNGDYLPSWVTIATMATDRQTFIAITLTNPKKAKIVKVCRAPYPEIIFTGQFKISSCMLNFKGAV